MTETMRTKKSKRPKGRSFLRMNGSIGSAPVQNKDTESILGESARLEPVEEAGGRAHAGCRAFLPPDRQGQAGNSRDGTSPKIIVTLNGESDLGISRDRLATCQQQLW